MTEVGLVQDDRTGHVTVVLSARGSQFGLLESEAQHDRLAEWGHVLAQFARESSPVVRLGWSLWSAPAAACPALEVAAVITLSAADDSSSEAASGDHQHGGQRLLHELAAKVTHHELAVWITLDPAAGARRHHPDHRPDPAQAALAALDALTERCRIAGLVVSGPLTSDEITGTLRRSANPFAPAAASPSETASPVLASSPPGATTSRGLAERAGLTGSPNRPADRPSAVEALHGSVRLHWDAVQIGTAWHRTFWVARWPDRIEHPAWLNPLLLNPAGVRTVSTSYEPIPPRTSRRRITSDAVALDSQIQLRHKHDIRIPVGLQRAQAEIDQREAELAAGHCEYGHVTLITVTAATPADLERDCQTLLDQAAHVGITELRPLHGRHDLAWAATLPFGRAAQRERLNGAAA